MICLVSEANFSREEAIKKAIGSIEKKGMAIWETTKKVTKVYEDTIREVYFPYYILDISYTAKAGLFKTVESRQIMAMEGVTGEVGVVVGPPIAQEKDIADEKLVPVRFEEEEADKRIIDYFERHLVRTRRQIPKITETKRFIIYKPAYLISMDFTVKGESQHCRKVVDAESGEMVYRYDFKEL